MNRDYPGAELNSRWSFLLSLAVTTVVLVFVWFVRHGLLLIWMSVVFAIVFTPAVKWIQRLRIGRWAPGKGTALLLLLLMIGLALGLFLFLAIPPIISDTRALSDELPQSLHELANQIRKLPLVNRITPNINENSIRSMILSAAGSATEALSQVTGMLTSVFMVILLTCYFILDGRRIFDWAIGFLPAHRRSQTSTTLLKARAVVQKWLLGQALLMLILGASSFVVFWALGVRYFYTLAVFAGLANFVPVLGPVATVIIAGLVAAIDSGMKLVGVCIFYLVYQQVENGYLSPKVMESAVGLPGAAVLAALLLGTELAGIAGALVAVPTAALISEIISDRRNSSGQQNDVQQAA